MVWDPWRDATWYATDARKPTAVESSASSSSVRPPRCSIVFPLVAAVRFESKSPNRGTKAKEKKKRKIRDFRISRPKRKERKATRCTVREFQARGKRKKKRRKENARIESLSFRPLVSFSFFFFFFFRPILNRVPKHPARTFRSTRFHY